MILHELKGVAFLAEGKVGGRLRVEGEGGGEEGGGRVKEDLGEEGKGGGML